MVRPASRAGRSDGIAAICLVNESSCRRSTSYAVAAMKSPIVSKWRNRAPTDTPARLVITAADARAYPTSRIVAMLASSNRATVSSRRCCWVAMSDPRGLPLTRVGPQIPARLHRLSIAVAESAVAEHDRAVDAGDHHRRVVAVDHAAQAAVERDLLLVVRVDRLVQAGG